MYFFVVHSESSCDLKKEEELNIFEMFNLVNDLKKTNKLDEFTVLNEIFIYSIISNQISCSPISQCMCIKV